MSNCGCYECGVCSCQNELQPYDCVICGGRKCSLHGGGNQNHVCPDCKTSNLCIDCRAYARCCKDFVDGKIVPKKTENI